MIVVRQPPPSFSKILPRTTVQPRGRSKINACLRRLPTEKPLGYHKVPTVEDQKSGRWRQPVPDRNLITEPRSSSSCTVASHSGGSPNQNAWGHGRISSRMGLDFVAFVTGYGGYCAACDADRQPLRSILSGRHLEAECRSCSPS